MKAKFLLITAFALLLASCVSTNKSREYYFGFNNEPKYENKTKTDSQSVPNVYSYQRNKETKIRKKQNDDGDTYIINNYYPYPYDPRYVRTFDPYDVDIFFFYGDKYYDPYCDSYVIFSPHQRRHYYIYYPHPYWGYWWERKPRVIYVPYDDSYEKPREKKVRDFGPSRGDYDFNNGNVPTKEARSPSRGNEVKKNIVPPDEPNRKEAEPVKLKLPDRSSTPRETPKNQEPPKSEPNTKQERSPTRPR